MTEIHGDEPIQLYSELCEVVENVIHHFFESEGSSIPIPKMHQNSYPNCQQT